MFNIYIPIRKVVFNRGNRIKTLITLLFTRTKIIMATTSLVRGDRADSITTIVRQI